MKTRRWAAVGTDRQNVSFGIFEPDRSWASIDGDVVMNVHPPVRRMLRIVRRGLSAPRLRAQHPTLPGRLGSLRNCLRSACGIEKTSVFCATVDDTACVLLLGREPDHLLIESPGPHITQAVGITHREILGAAVAMVHEVGRAVGATVVDRLLQRIEHDVGPQRGRDTRTAHCWSVRSMPKVRLARANRHIWQRIHEMTSSLYWRERQDLSRPEHATTRDLPVASPAHA